MKKEEIGYGRSWKTMTQEELIRERNSMISAMDGASGEQASVWRSLITEIETHINNPFVDHPFNVAMRDPQSEWY